MLIIDVPLGEEQFDNELQQFVPSDDVFQLTLQHSLASLSKWERIFEKPFLGGGEKTSEEVIGYIECMVVTPNVPSEVFQKLTQAHFETINAHIDSKDSATWFSDTGEAPKSREVITCEIIYYWMIKYGLTPISDYEYWHLNRLFTQLRVFSVKDSPQKTIKGPDAAARMREISRQRREALGSSG